MVIKSLKEIYTINQTLYISINVVSYCNLQCNYCLYKEHNKYKIDFQKLLNFILYIYNSLYKNIEIILVGGEPTLHPDLYEFCVNLTNNKIRYAVFSNGTANIEYYTKLMSLDLCDLEFSYHSINNKYNIDFFKKTRALINIADHNRKYDNKLLINVMAEDTDLKHLQSLITVFNSFNIPNKYLFIAPIFIDNKLKNYSQQYLNYVLEFNKYKDVKLNVIDILDQHHEIMQQYVSINGLNNFYNWHCNAGLNRIYINSNGDIYHCEEEYILKQKPFFNFYTQPYEQFTLSATKCICNMCMCNINLNKKYETSNRI